MKKIVALLLALAMVAALAACAPAGNNPTTTAKPGTTGIPTTGTPTTTPPPTNTPDTEKGEGVMTFEQFFAAELETEVTIEAYVQATQSWWDNKITVYTQDAEGAYFLYEMPCSEEDAKKLVPGTKIRVTGTKTAWSGEVEIVDITKLEILEGYYFADPVDMTATLGDYDAMMKQMNMLGAFKGMTVEGIEFKNGEPGDDIYVNLIAPNGLKFQFCVERYLTGPETEVYKTVSGLNAGDVIDVEGFAYWYENLNAHITNVFIAHKETKGEGVMTYAEYDAAALESKVTIEAYVQATQSWWDGKITVYTQDFDGAYFLYEMPCSEEDAAKLVKGAKIRVTGYKAEWQGEVEITDIEELVFLEGNHVFAPIDVTDLMLDDEWKYDEARLIKYQNRLVSFSRMTLEKIEYKNGEPGDDIYVTVSLFDEITFQFCVERYLTGPETDVYKAFAELEAGDTITIVGFLYWYNGPNTHITEVYKSGR